MPQTPHVERHFTGGEVVRDIVIGMSDGLTVPFALAAGLSGAIASTRIIVTAGLAEIAAGSIAMRLGGYLAARSDAEHYTSERAREQREIDVVPEVEADEVRQIFQAAECHMLGELHIRALLLPASTSRQGLWGHNLDPPSGKRIADERGDT